MSNRTVPATAEGLSKPDPSELETLIDDARLFANLVNYLASEMIGGSHDSAGMVRVREHDRDLLMFAALQSVKAAELANAEFMDFARNAR